MKRVGRNLTSWKKIVWKIKGKIEKMLRKIEEKSRKN